MEVFEFYPQAIIRELIANAIIHQDLSMTGSEIKIEVYDNRVEITNPGKSVIDLWRFYDCNKSRNEKLAYYMRQLKLCEELGSGIDRIVEISELNNLFTPKFIITNEYVNAKLFREKKFEQMVEEDKINILYYHCCFRYSIEDYMTNSSLRNRFLLYIKSEGCSVCEADFPKVKEITDKNNYTSYYIQADEMAEAVGQLNLYTVPVIILFYNGKEIHRQARIIDFSEFDYRIKQTL